MPKNQFDVRGIAQEQSEEVYGTPAQAAAFDRCVDYLTMLIEKYGAIVSEELRQEAVNGK